MGPHRPNDQRTRSCDLGRGSRSAGSDRFHCTKYCLRQPRLLGPAVSEERGSAPVESTFAFVFILFLVLGVIEVDFSLYGRNVVLASAHEGARAAVEVVRDPAEAAAIAEQTVRRAAGSLVDDLRVSVSTRRGAGTSIVSVRVSGEVDALGPVPWPMHVDTVASATQEGLPE